VQSISEIYARQVREDVDITDLTSLNTENGAMGQVICLRKEGEAPQSRTGEEGRRCSNFRWSHGHHIWICDWAQVFSMGTSHSVGKVEKGDRKI
jgi:hypothetical protein